MTTVFRTKEASRLRRAGPGLALAAVMGLVPVIPIVATPAPAHAQAADESEQITVEATHHVRVVYHARDLQDVTHARRFIGRLDKAALVACGDDTAIAEELRRAIERSDCRRDGVLRAIADVRDPMLDQALARYGLPT
ncbi:UrcA family protein [Gluconacetobacter tumulisoli]|uniref:UrcA family protein n=1 Tax=Gluconacetobacter tumulisoli TaxID=1286189 RepID=A0A7W4K556_9PROT|nr:UrcA family protein [Gluconacetobacter tumulisoli]MBB2200541.1 UrcA family protein [Gluconacetobacter tumulisoli]